MTETLSLRGAGLACVLLLAGCATVTRGTTDVLVIETEPPGAEAILSNGLRCRTPCALTLRRDESVVVDILREGYEPVRATVKPRIAGAGAAGMAGNVILGGLIGAAIDAGSGAMYDLTPNPLKVRLVPLDGREEDAVSEVRSTDDVRTDGPRDAIPTRLDERTPGQTDKPPATPSSGGR